MTPDRPDDRRRPPEYKDQDPSHAPEVLLRPDPGLEPAVGSLVPVPAAGGPLVPGIPGDLLASPGALPDGPEANLTILEDPKEGLLVPGRGPTLYVTQSGRTGRKLQFTLFVDGTPYQFGSTAVPSQIDRILTTITGLLTVFAEHEALDQDTRSARTRAFEAEGQLLFNQLVPAELADQIKRWPDDLEVRIATNDMFVPWELLHDGKGFLWRRFLLFRLPHVDGKRAAVPSPGHLQPGRPVLRDIQIVHVIGPNLGDGLERELQSFFPGLVPRPRYTVEHIVRERGASIVGRLATADIIHFDCHGYRGDPVPRLQTFGRVPPPGRQPPRPSAQAHFDQLTLALVESADCRLRPGCFVFANACEADSVDVLFETARSFGRAFYQKGASAFIGTLGKVPAAAAAAFAGRFYRALADDRSGDLGNAFREARKDPDLPPVLIYCLYGNPVTLPRILFQ